MMKKITDRYILLILWICVQTYLLFVNGIKLDGEGGRIINEAAHFLTTGKLTANSDHMYLTQICLILFCLKFGIGFYFVVAVQLILNLIALLNLNKFMRSFYSSKKLAFIGCLLLLICYPYQIYNSFLYTESIFFSLVIIFSCYLLRTTMFSIKRSAILLLLLLLLCITRPSGIFFLGAAIVYIYFKISGHLSLWARIMLFAGLSAIALSLLNILMGSGGGINIILPFKDERIICEVPTLSYNVDIKVLSDSNSLYGLLYYVIHNFDQFTRLAWLKTKAFFGLYRPYYSIFHNVFILTFFYPLYIFTIAVILKLRMSLPVSFIYFIAIAIIFWLSVVLSCDEWHNRFFLTLVPLLITPALYLFSKEKKSEHVSSDQ